MKSDSRTAVNVTTSQQRMNFGQGSPLYSEDYDRSAMSEMVPVYTAIESERDVTGTASTMVKNHNNHQRHRKPTKQQQHQKKQKKQVYHRERKPQLEQKLQRDVDRDSSYTNIYPEQESPDLYNPGAGSQTIGVYNPLEQHGYTVSSSLGPVQESGISSGFLAGLRGAKVLLPALFVTGLLFFIPSVVDIDRMDSTKK